VHPDTAPMALATRSQAPTAWAARNRSLLVGLVILGVIVVVSAFAPMIARRSPTAIGAHHILSPPSGSALFGTDDYGRDMFSRVLYAGRYDLGIALLSALVAAGIGVPIGALLGYFGSIVDTAAMRLLEIIQAFPVLILALLLVATLGPTIGVIVFVCAALSSTSTRQGSWASPRGGSSSGISGPTRQDLSWPTCRSVQ
jgi:peptide/nickel transport system permease protein